MKTNEKTPKFNFKNFRFSNRRPRIKILKPNAVSTVDFVPMAKMEISESLEPPDIISDSGALVEKAITYRLPRDLASRDEDEREDRRYEGASYQQLVLEGIVFKYF